ncbi:MAG: ferrous iron transport protein B [Eggerthellales bacterium]|nr:ferrous iron transport protein B [Eggerthellales bacterium]
MSNCCEPGKEMPDISIDSMGEGRVAVHIDDAAMTLADLPIGKNAVICQVGGEGSLRQHFLDMGLIPEASVTMVKHAPMGDPVQVRIHGYELTLRLEDAARISVRDVMDEEAANAASHPRNTGNPLKNGVFPGGHPHEVEHPGLGEGGRFHDAASESPLPLDQTLTFALVGNQNCGKTTLFNQLTGSNQHVGNFPGVTVDRKDGPLLGHENTLVTDLPGIYSMSPYSAEEIVTRQFVLEDKPRGIINIVDATNIERNLYLTMQLLELGVPMVLALNMMDEVSANGGSVLVNELESQLGIPVVPISAIKGEGISELVNHAMHVAYYREAPKRQDFCDAAENGGAVHRCLHGIMHLIEDHAKRADVPQRFAASKLAEGDPLVARVLKLDDNELETIEHLVKQMETESGLDRAAALARMRFSFIERVCGATVVKPRESREHARSQKMDRILTGRFTALPSFVLIMLVVFYLTFEVVGAWLQELLEMGIGFLSDLCAQVMEAAEVNEVLESFVIDGIFGGVGSVLSFLPIIAVLFFFLSLLEDSGYLARVAFVMDKPLRKLGLSGRSIVPMLIGFGCSVPSVMASRTLPSERDRKLTIMLTPFMSCSAKLPIYVFLGEALFPQQAGLVVGLLYVLGIVVGILVAFLLRKIAFKGEAVPFVMELPNYRIPAPKNVAHLLWDKCSDFLHRAFTVILLAVLIIWALQTFSFGLNVVDDSAESMLAQIAGALAPLLSPLGLGDWRVATALVSGFIAKESVVATMIVLYGGAETLAALFTPLMGVCLLVFCLLYTPCVAAIASINRELGWKWAIGVACGQCLVAWIVAFAVRCVGLLLGFA